MDTPTPLIFISTPYEGGIAAEAACVKPDHVAGVSAALSYDYAFSVLLMQDPDIERVGVIHSTSDASGRHGAEQIMESAGSLGIEVHIQPVSSPWRIYARPPIAWWMPGSARSCSRLIPSHQADCPSSQKSPAKLDCRYFFPASARSFTAPPSARARRRCTPMASMRGAY